MKLYYTFRGQTFVYELEEVDIKEAIEDIFSRKYGISCYASSNIIDDLELWSYLADEYYDDIVEEFRLNALEEFEKEFEEK